MRIWLSRSVVGSWLVGLVLRLVLALVYYDWSGIGVTYLVLPHTSLVVSPWDCGSMCSSRLVNDGDKNYCPCLIPLLASYVFLVLILKFRSIVDSDAVSVYYTMTRHWGSVRMTMHWMMWKIQDGKARVMQLFHWSSLAFRRSKFVTHTAMHCTWCMLWLC